MNRALHVVQGDPARSGLTPAILETYSQALQALNRIDEARNAREEAQRIRAWQALTVRVR